MSTKLRSWNVRRVVRSAPNVSTDPENPVLAVRTVYESLGKLQAVTREEATSEAQRLHPGVEIDISRDE